MIVFDSSALLVFLLDERGAETVEGLIDDTDDKCIHSVNLCEVYYKLLRVHGAAIAEEGVNDVRALGIVERNDLDGEFWRDAAQLLVTQRTGGHGLAFGDACGLALARRLSADFITADHPEMEPIAAADLCSVVFVR